MLVEDEVVNRIFFKGDLLNLIALNLLNSILSGLELDSKDRVRNTIDTYNIVSCNTSWVSMFVFE